MSEEKNSAATQAWSDAIQAHALALLRLSYASKETNIAEEIKTIAYALLALSRETLSS